MTGIEKHPYFDLWLHSTDELERILQIRIATRETIHDWPLSTVQRITTEDGYSIIYKVQHLAMVEPRFYRSATSKLLPKSEDLGAIHGCQAMIFEFIDGERLAECNVDEAGLIRIGRELQTEIQDIKGDLPLFRDIGNRQKWIGFAESVLIRLADLMERRIFQNVSTSLVQELRDWAYQSAVVDIVNKESCLTHGDLNGENIFVLPDGYKLIDWQRPCRAPYDVDMVGLLLDKGFNPSLHVNREVIQIFHFLRIDWFTQCRASLFPEGLSYERSVISAAETLLEHRTLFNQQDT
ncbi:MAG TPA: phosphotransferase [Anaerolineales bacterium]|nr:phosphotransferase [Anaerolineales bacterium]